MPSNNTKEKQIKLNTPIPRESLIKSPLLEKTLLSNGALLDKSVFGHLEKQPRMAAINKSNALQKKASKKVNVEVLKTKLKPKLTPKLNKYWLNDKQKEKKTFQMISKSKKNEQKFKIREPKTNEIDINTKGYKSIIAGYNFDAKSKAEKMTKAAALIGLGTLGYTFLNKDAYNELLAMRNAQRLKDSIEQSKYQSTDYEDLYKSMTSPAGRHPTWHPLDENGYAVLEDPKEVNMELIREEMKREGLLPQRLVYKHEGILKQFNNKGFTMNDMNNTIIINKENINPISTTLDQRFDTFHKNYTQLLNSNIEEGIKKIMQLNNNPNFFSDKDSNKTKLAKKLGIGLGVTGGISGAALLANDLMTPKIITGDTEQPVTFKTKEEILPTEELSSYIKNQAKDFTPTDKTNSIESDLKKENSLIRIEEIKNDKNGSKGFIKVWNSGDEEGQPVLSLEEKNNLGDFINKAVFGSSNPFKPNLNNTPEVPKIGQNNLLQEQTMQNINNSPNFGLNLHFSDGKLKNSSKLNEAVNQYFSEKGYSESTSQEVIANKLMLFNNNLSKRLFSTTNKSNLINSAVKNFSEKEDKKKLAKIAAVTAGGAGLLGGGTLLAKDHLLNKGDANINKEGTEILEDLVKKDTAENPGKLNQYGIEQQNARVKDMYNALINSGKTHEEALAFINANVLGTRNALSDTVSNIVGYVEGGHLKDDILNIPNHIDNHIKEAQVGRTPYPGLQFSDKLNALNKHYNKNFSEKEDKKKLAKIAAVTAGGAGLLGGGIALGNTDIDNKAVSAVADAYNSITPGLKKSGDLIIDATGNVYEKVTDKGAEYLNKIKSMLPGGENFSNMARLGKQLQNPEIREMLNKAFN